MKLILYIYCILNLLTFGKVNRQSQHIDFEALDNAIDNKEYYIEQKEKRLEALKNKASIVINKTEKYTFNKLIYNEYILFQSDSAYTYAKRNLQIAHELNDKEKIIESKLNLASIHAATGLFLEAKALLDSIDDTTLDRNLLVYYLKTTAFFYSHLGLYINNSDIFKPYLNKEIACRKHLLELIDKNDPEYLWQKTELERISRTPFTLKKELLEKVSAQTETDRYKAPNYYMLAIIAEKDNERVNTLKYLTQAAIADIIYANREIGALTKLAELLLEEGDLKRADKYINSSLQDLHLFSNRPRVSEITKGQNIIRTSYQEALEQQSHYLQIILATSIGFILMAVGTIYWIRKQELKLSISQIKLDKANLLLAEQLKEVTENNNRLLQLTHTLNETKENLKEANYIKEEYIAYVFRLCSGYIGKLDEFQKNLNRRIKSGQINDVKQLLKSASSEIEMKKFYNSFDSVFLRIYPNFVEEFNQLLRPEERIELQKDDLLTPELRIYALVRLGITDSIRIAEFLHYSPQTIYNYRLKMRNKARVNKEEFPDYVRKLGKIDI